MGTGFESPMNFWLGAGTRRPRFYALISAFLWFGLPCAFLLSIGIPEKFLYPPFIGILVVFFYLIGRVRSKAISLMLFNSDLGAPQGPDDDSPEYGATEERVPPEAVQEQQSHSVEHVEPPLAAERAMHMTCKATIRLICEYLEGKLSPELGGEVQRHLSICANCRGVFDAAALTLEAYFDRENVEGDQIRRKKSA
jgi:hypothetical protein